MAKRFFCRVCCSGFINRQDQKYDQFHFSKEILYKNSKVDSLNVKNLWELGAFKNCVEILYHSSYLAEKILNKKSKVDSLIVKML